MSYFRVAFLIFVPSLLSESLTVKNRQANGKKALTTAKQKLGV